MLSPWLDSRQQGLSLVTQVSHKAHFIESRATVCTQRERRVVMTKLKEEAVSIMFLIHHKESRQYDPVFILIM
jgi:hypothetical protein